MKNIKQQVGIAALLLIIILMTAACSISINTSINATPDEDIKADTPDGWLTYENDKYNYEFSYPTEATIGEADKNAFNMTPEEYKSGFTFEGLLEKYTGKICVNARVGTGYVAIAAAANEKPNGDTVAMCLRTGAGVCSPASQKKGGLSGNYSSNVTVDGKKYTAQGIENNCPGDAQPYAKSLRVKLDDGTKIEFGGFSNSKEEYATLEAKLLQIVESYQRK